MEKAGEFSRMAAANNSQQTASEALLESIRPSVFKIEADGSRGTGWRLDENTIVTSYHVIKGHRQISAIGVDGKRYRLGGEVTFDSENDIAILTFAGTKPAFGQPIERAQSSALSPKQPIYSVGHPHGGEAKSVEGTFQQRSTWKGWLSVEANVPNNPLRAFAADRLKSLTPEQLSRPLVVTNLDVTHGCSGAPITDADRRVIAIVTRGTADDGPGYDTTVEQVNDVVNARFDLNKFEHRTGHHEMGLITHFKKADHAPGMFMAENLGLFGGFYGASRLMGYSCDPMCLISRTSALRAGLLAPAAVGVVGYFDADGLIRSTSTADSIKYGLSTLSDATMVSGLASRYVSALRSSGIDKAGRVGKALFLGGAAARVMCELIPNNYVVDVGSKETAL